MSRNKYMLGEAIKSEVFTYLDALRESGVTNMFGAVPYIRRVFPELSWEESSTLLVEWMENFRKT